MKTHRTISIGILLCAAFASCSPLPTENATVPERAGYNGGVTIGSGNGVGTGDAGTMDGGATPTDSTGRGGFGVGSGN